MVTLLSGDIVIARREVLSDAAIDKVGKIIYHVSRPFITTESTGHGFYFASRSKNKNIVEQNFIAEDLYPLPPSLLSCDPIDEVGIIYLNYSHPTINPCDPIDGAGIRHLHHSHLTINYLFEKDLNIKSYHETHFSSPQLLTPPTFDYNHESLKFVHPSSPTLYPYVIKIIS